MDEKQPQTILVPRAADEFDAGPRQAELASLAMAEMAKASVQARYLMALRRPRDLMQVRERLLADCRRPKFADAAIYHKPVGDGLEGPSIRMAEAAARAMTNILTSASAVHDDDKKRIIHVSATDLECNLTYDRDVTVTKTIERRKVPEGRKVLGSRINSQGEMTYTIEAVDEEILDKEGRQISLALRTCLLRMIPGDILDEAVQLCYETMANRDAADPDASVKAMCDSFAEVNVTAVMLSEYLGHPLQQTTPAEMRRLRGTYNAINNGEATWAQVLAAKGVAKKTEQQQQPPAGEKPVVGAEKTPAPEKPRTLAAAAEKSRQARVKLEVVSPDEPGSNG